MGQEEEPCSNKQLQSFEKANKVGGEELKDAGQKKKDIAGKEEAGSSSKEPQKADSEREEPSSGNQLELFEDVNKIRQGGVNDTEQKEEDEPGTEGEAPSTKETQKAESGRQSGKEWHQRPDPSAKEALGPHGHNLDLNAVQCS